MTSSDLLTLGGTVLAIGVGTLAIVLSTRQLTNGFQAIRSMTLAVLESLDAHGWIELGRDPETGNMFDRKGRLAPWHVPQHGDRAGYLTMASLERRPWGFIVATAASLLLMLAGVFLVVLGVVN